MARVFVTYSHQDQEFVEQLVADLESSGLAMVFDKQLMLPGNSLFKIFEEIGTVDFLLAILSPHSVNSSWVQKELEGAVVREIEETDFKVIPIIKVNSSWVQKELEGAVVREIEETDFKGLPATDESKSSFAGKIQGPVLRQAILHGLERDSGGSFCTQRCASLVL